MDKKHKDLNAEYPKWTDSAERLILYADIMGFKEKVYSKTHDELKKELFEFKEKWSRYMSPLQINDYLRFAQFSDSILIVANGVDRKMFNIITKAAFRLMHAAMEMRFAIKGVLSQGPFLFDVKRELYFGRPLVDAALLYDEIYFYGIIVHHSAEKTVKEFSDDSNPYKKSRVKLKSGIASHYYLAWNLLDKTLGKNDNTEQCQQWLNEIEEEVSGRPRIYVENTVNILERKDEH